jgi:hypothetical protein
MLQKLVRFLLIAFTAQTIIYFIVKALAPQLIFINLLFGFSITIILIGALILFLKAKQDQFVGRFMLATTFQMIAVLSLVLAFSYKKTVDALPHALWLLAFFITHLIYQSLYLIRQSKKQESSKG